MFFFVVFRWCFALLWFLLLASLSWLFSGFLTLGFSLSVILKSLSFGISFLRFFFWLSTVAGFVRVLRDDTLTVIKWSFWLLHYWLVNSDFIVSLLTLLLLLSLFPGTSLLSLLQILYFFWGSSSDRIGSSFSISLFNFLRLLLLVHSFGFPKAFSLWFLVPNIISIKGVLGEDNLQTWNSAFLVAFFVLQ